MKEMLIKLYELNEHYHDTKEKMAWLACSLYSTFSIAMLTIFFIEGIQDFIATFTVPIIIILLAVCSLALWFINFQYKKKRISVAISKEYMKILTDQESSIEDKLRIMLEKNVELNTKWKYFKKINKYSGPEWPTKALIVVFFGLQILITLYLALDV